jgi:carboxymethylenebutenolidase
MAKLVDYYFSPKSPWSYLGHSRFTQLVKKHGARVNVKAVDLPRVFSVSGGVPLKQRAPQRQAYRLVELKRFREHLNIPFNLEPKHFPGPGHDAPKLIIAADIVHGAEVAMEVAYGLMKACWAEDRSIDDAETRAAIVRAAGRDPAALAAPAVAEAAAAKYEAYTQEAIDRNVFGAPSYVIDGVIFWGQDRLEFVDRALAG